MYNPIENLTTDAVAPVTEKPATPPRDGIANSRGFAEILAEAEAVKDHVAIQHNHRRGTGGLPGMLQGAWMMLTHRTPGRHVQGTVATKDIKVRGRKEQSAQNG